MDKEVNAKGAQVVVVSTGGGDSLMEFYGDVESITSRLHQVISDRLKCHPQACPEEGNGNGRTVAIEKAMTLQYGRLLIKEEVRLVHERSTISQNIAFQTARRYTSNAEQKRILRGWKITGSEEFKMRRAEQIVQTTAEIDGIDPEEIRGFAENEEGGKKRVVGEERRNRVAVGWKGAAAESSSTGNDRGQMRHVFRFPAPHTNKYPQKKNFQ